MLIRSAIRSAVAILSRNKWSQKQRRPTLSGGSSYWSTSLGWVTSTNLVGLNGHFQTTVYAFQFHSGQQQTFGANRRSNFGRKPATSARRTSTKTVTKHRHELPIQPRQRLHSYSQEKTRSSCSLQQQARRGGALASHPPHWWICLRHRYRLIVGKAISKHR